MNALLTWNNQELNKIHNINKSGIIFYAWIDHKQNIVYILKTVSMVKSIFSNK